MKENKYGYTVEMYHLSADMGGGLLASLPELPGCVGVGYSVEEALASVSSLAERLHQQLDTVPVQLSSQVQRKLVRCAEQTGMTVNDLVANLLSDEMIDNKLIALTE